MTTQNAPVSVPVDTGPTTNPPAAAASPSLAWLKGALLLAGAAQLITISALTSADPLAVTWSSLLLAIAILFSAHRHRGVAARRSCPASEGHHDRGHRLPGADPPDGLAGEVGSRP